MTARHGPWFAALVVLVLLASAVAFLAGPTPRRFGEGAASGPALGPAPAPAAAAPLALTGPAGTWTPIRGGIPDRGYTPMVYDAAENVFITHGGTTWSGYDLNQTWSYDPVANLWTNLTAGGGPAPRSGFGMVYDSRADFVVLFGGRDVAGSFYSDTWLYNVSVNAWVPLFPANLPPARASFGMVYDSAADRILVFGGYAPSSLRDTWSFDLTNHTWTDLSPAISPSPRDLPSMAYDAAADLTVLFGGDAVNFPGGIDDTWTYDYGTNTWTNVTGTTAPPARIGGAMSYDSTAQLVILFGGDTYPGAVNDTWTYDASQDAWANVSGTVAPSTYLVSEGMAFDPVRDLTLLFGGIFDPGAAHSFWSFDLAARTWTNLGTPVTGLARAFESLVYDSGEGVLVMFGGITYVPGGTDVTNQTWTLDPGSGVWANRTGGETPPARSNASMAYDPVAGRIILFGGGPFPGIYRNDTWSFNPGTDTWTNVTTAGPSPRGSAAMAYDANQDRMLLFGGAGPAGYLGDTWSYDVGTETWTNVTPATSPSPRVSDMMAFDPAANRSVLFGGYGPSGYLSDTWAFDLSSQTWTALGALQPPTPRGFGGMVYDVAHGRFILFGGYGEFGALSETWHYDYPHSAWSMLFPATSPSARGSFGMAYDLRDARTILVGGFNAPGVASDVWSYTYPNPPSAPQNLSAVAAVGQVTLTWSPPPSDGGAPIGSYIVYRGTASGGETPGAGTGGATAYTDAYVSGGTTYYYEVAAYNAAGAGARSAEVSATPPPVPDTLAPTLTIVAPKAGANLTSPFAVVAGSASDNVAITKIEVRADGSAWALAVGTNSWAGCVTLQVGYNVIDARATDTSGNTNTTSIGVILLAPPSNSVPAWVIPVIGAVVLIAVVGTALVTYRLLRPKTTSPPNPAQPPAGPRS